MKWNIKQHKRGNGQQEIQVSIRVKELNDVMANTSEEWINIFKNSLKEIKKSNSFSAENGFKATPRNHTSLEVWKLKANGDFNYLMFTVTRNDSN